MNELIYSNTDNIIEDACKIIDSAKETAYSAVNITLTIRNWLLGRRIAEEDLKGAERAEYGKEVVKNLSKNLTAKYGRGFSSRVLYKFLKFYRLFPDIVPIASAQSSESEKVPMASAQLLSWSHYKYHSRKPLPSNRWWMNAPSFNNRPFSQTGTYV